MRLIHPRLLLALAASSVLCWARNFGPRAPGSVRQLPPQPSARESHHVVISEDHVFYENYLKNVEWFSEAERRVLFKLPDSKDMSTTGPLVRRVLVPSTGIAPDTCLGCANAGNLRPADTSWLTTQYFQSVMLKKGANLLNNCLFYSAIFQPADLAKWLLKYQPFPPGVDPALSELATHYACNNELNTIWMLWPGISPTGENPQSATDPSTYNYFEMFVVGSWLAPIVANGQVRTYFENMSRAMALTCGGIIRVLSEDPTNLSKYVGTIWQAVELPALQSRLGGGALSPSSLISIDANNMAFQYKLDWTTNKVISKRALSQDDPDYWWGWNKTVSSRDTCDANIVYETASGMDWFG